MIRIAVLGSGHVGHALAGLLGANCSLEVVLWGRSLERSHEVAITVAGTEGLHAVGRVNLETSLLRAVHTASIVVIAVPAHVRHDLLRRIRGSLVSCVLLLAWEGMGKFSESVQALNIRAGIAVGLQRSPLVCRVKELHKAVTILGVRSRVVAAPVDPGALTRVEEIISTVLPFHFSFANDYRYASLSPGNPLIHPARIYTHAKVRSVVPDVPFYGDWDNIASQALLGLHRELALLREHLQLSPLLLSTLADRNPAPSTEQLTEEIRATKELDEVRFPLRVCAGGPKLDWSHRFLQEDIGEGLMYIHEVAQKHEVRLEVTKSICDWYAKHSSVSRA